MNKSKFDDFIKSIKKAQDLLSVKPSPNSKNYLLLNETLTDCESGEDVTMEDIFGESNDNLKLLDKWVEKQLLGNPEIKPYNKRPYPYRKYHMLDELLRKHGKEFISKMRASMPRNLKKNTDEDTLIDSVAWIIWDKKLDAKSIMSELPEFGSIWDKISEDGYAE